MDRKNRHLTERKKMSTKNESSRARKSLAEQIDRLDTILDGLANNLNEAVAMAVADAVKEVLGVAVQKAVHTALVEVMTNTELQKRLAINQADPVEKVEATAHASSGLGDKMRRCWAWLAGKVQAAWSGLVAVTVHAGNRVKTAIGSVIATVTYVGRQVRDQVIQRGRIGWMMAAALVALAFRYRTQSMVAGAIGLIVGLASYHVGPLASSVVCGLAGGILALASGMPARMGSRTMSASTRTSATDWVI
jgi:hypothetical protein